MNHNNQLHTAAKWFRQISVLSIILVSFLGCRAESIGFQPEPAITPSLIAEAQTESLPPNLVETQPMSGSVIFPQEGVTFYFDQPIDTGSLQAGFKSLPDLPAKFEWKNPQTVQWIPSGSLPARTSIHFLLTSAVRSVDGLGLNRDFDLTYKTGDALKVIERIPAPGTSRQDPSSAVMVTFNQPVAPFGGQMRDFTPAFTLEPGSSGNGEWLNSSSYIFYPSPSMASGTTVDVLINPSLTSTSGVALDTGSLDERWQFSTSEPAISDLVPESEIPLGLDDPFMITFNQPMEPRSVETNLNLTSLEGDRVPGSFTWEDEGRIITFQPAGRLERNTQYQLSLTTGARSMGGAPLSESLDVIYLTYGKLSLSNSEPVMGGILDIPFDYSSIKLVFNTPLDRKTLASAITIEPSLIDQSISLGWENQSSIFISGIFKHRTKYEVRINQTLADQWGGNLEEPQILRFTTASARSSLSLPGLYYNNQTQFIPAGNPILNARIANIRSLDVVWRRISLADFFELAQMPYLEFPKVNEPEYNRHLEPKLEPGKTSTIAIPLTHDNAALETGLYHIGISSSELPADDPQSSPLFLMVSSNTHLTVKKGQDSILVWAVNLLDNRTLPGADVKAYTITGQLLAAGKTDKDGLVTLKLEGGLPDDTQWVVMLGEPGDTDFSLATEWWSNGVAAWDFNLPLDFSSAQYKTYLYTDRPIYRAGQDVNFRAILRSADNGRYSLPDIDQIDLKIMGEKEPYGGQIDLAALSLPLSEFGSAEGSFTLPEDAPPGYYSIQLEKPLFAYLGFQVAEYQKPEFEIDFELPDTDLQPQEDLSAKVVSTYYFGAPAGNQPIHWALYAKESRLLLPNSYDTGPSSLWGFGPYFNPVENPQLGNFLIEGTGETSEDGSFQLTIPGKELEELLHPFNRTLLTLEITAEDDTGRTVSNRASIFYHPASFYIGMRPEQWVGQENEPLGISVVTVDRDIKAAGGRLLKASFEKVTWNESESDVPILSIGGRTPEYALVSSVDMQTDSLGRARLEFIPPEPGNYRVLISGQGSVSSIYIWVTGTSTTNWLPLPNQQIQITTDTSSYLPGQTARVFIPNPFGTPVTGLLTVERSRVMRSEVITIDGAGYAYDLALSDEDAPNIYISVTLLGNQPDGTPDFRQGYINIDVEPIHQVLEVSITPERQVSQPSDTVRWKVVIKDADGKPVRGEFSMAVVDKAVLALADPNIENIIEAFYGHQNLGVTSSISLAGYPGRFTQTPVGGLGGGGDLAGPEIREKFADTAFWNGTLVTNANGEAEVEFALPDNLTTWIALVRGITLDTLVGEATNELVTQKQLMVQPATPRFLGAGDHLMLEAVVHNTTSQQIDADVSLQATGFELDNPLVQTQKVTLPANSRISVSWWGKVQTVEAVDLVFTALSGELQDAARPEFNPLPVKRYLAPITYSSSGIMTEENEQLEIISLPASYEPDTGELSVEISPSLAASIISDMRSLENYPYDLTEPVLSRLLPNLATYKVLKDQEIGSPLLEADLVKQINAGLRMVFQLQNGDGGWGWTSGKQSDGFLSAYALFALAQARQTGFDVGDEMIQKAQEHLASIVSHDPASEQWQYERKIFQIFSLQVSGYPVEPGYYLLYKDQLNPWAKSLLAVSLFEIDPSSSRSLLSEVQSSVLRSSSGASWQDEIPGWWNFSSPLANTAMVTYAMATLDPASLLINDSVRYLVLNRKAAGGWNSSYETSWILLAMTKVMTNTGELQADFTYKALLNDQTVLEGKAGGHEKLQSVSSSTPISGLNNQDRSNTLRLQRGPGNGRMYYRALLDLFQPADQAGPIFGGLTLDRSYHLAGSGCNQASCPMVDTVSLDQEIGGKLLVRLSLIVPEDQYFVVVEDYFPSGSEPLDLSLKTSQQGAQQTLDRANPAIAYEEGWGWWWFDKPRIYDDRIRWMAEFLPAGTYQLSYQLQPLIPGEYQIIPAHAYQYYFPDVQGRTSGSRIKFTD